MEQNSTQELMTLEDVFTEQSTDGRPVKAFVAFNTGFKTLTVLMSLFELQEFTEVANAQSPLDTDVAQRKLDPVHAIEIARYIVKGVLTAANRKKHNQGQQLSSKFLEIQKNMGTQPYLSIPPLVASLRNCMPNGTNLAVLKLLTVGGETASYRIFLKPGDTLWVVDGQHRRMGLQLVVDFLKYVTKFRKYPAKGSLYPGDSKEHLSSEEVSVWSDCFEMLNMCQVAVEIHLGLNIEQERQLFHDLNNLSKKIDKSLALTFDGSNPVNSFIGDVILSKLFVDFSYPEISEKEKSDGSLKGLTRQDLVAINALLFLNKTNITTATPALTNPKLEVAEEFWKIVLGLPGFVDDSARAKTVAAYPVVLKALAKLVYDFKFGKNNEWVTPQWYNTLLKGIESFDFSSENQLWRYYQLSEDQRDMLFPGLRDYMPLDIDGQSRNIGNYEEGTGVFKFENRHNDIYPIIGDMIRWKLKLPSRRKSTI